MQLSVCLESEVKKLFCMLHISDFYNTLHWNTYTPKIDHAFAFPINHAFSCIFPINMQMHHKNVLVFVSKAAMKAILPLSIVSGGNARRVTRVGWLQLVLGSLERYFGRCVLMLRWCQWTHWRLWTPALIYDSYCLPWPMALNHITACHVTWVYFWQTVSVGL